VLLHSAWEDVDSRTVDDVMHVGTSVFGEMMASDIAETINVSPLLLNPYMWMTKQSLEHPNGRGSDGFPSPSSTNLDMSSGYGDQHV
jgi:hypothetical protein